MEALSLEAVAEGMDRSVGDLARAGASPPRELLETAWDLLDLVARRDLRRRIRDAAAEEAWAGRILRLVEGSHYNCGRLLERRAAAGGSRPLFLLPGPSGRTRVLTRRQAFGRADLLARGLLGILEEIGPTPVAVLSENRLETALLDLACLGAGIVNVPLPATATQGDVDAMLPHSRAGVAIASTSGQLRKLLRARESWPGLRAVVTLDAAAAAEAAARGERGVVPIEGLLERAAAVPACEPARRRDAVRIGDLATIMYTSGTTGAPKGIPFTHRNIVFKRFARALALPEIGRGDRFLCYLPLYHTFGRFLELWGCVFGGASYCFAPNPAAEGLARRMREVRATVFISVPAKWMQLHHLVCRRVDVTAASDREVEAALREVTGGDLRWGLSAAGRLDPEIFRFFRRHGVELLSGFGMTEATGGITMTPPGRYEDDSLGRALPGIETRLAPDGELLVRGPYVSAGSLDPEGWFPTGDIMEADREGFLRIVDRKKEIYKNVKGQTIAPRKIEDLLRDFDSVRSVFLVGDGRPYNTLLIRPDPECRDLDPAALSPEGLEEHFRSLVVTANSFLAPFERIVDFALIERDFDPARGEVTPKGTFRRRTIERHFAREIRLLYRRSTLRAGGVDVTVPNWLYQVLGITTQGLRAGDDRLVVLRAGGAGEAGGAGGGASLTVRRAGAGEALVGSVVYAHGGRGVDLGTLLSTPRLWLGNEGLVDFAPLEPSHRERRRLVRDDHRRLRREGPFAATPEDREALRLLLAKEAPDLLDLHRAALLLESDRAGDAGLAVRALEAIAGRGEGPLADLGLGILRRASGLRFEGPLRRAFQVLALRERREAYPGMLAAFLEACPALLDPRTVAVLVERGLDEERLGAFLEAAEGRGGASRSPATALSIFSLLAEYGAAHPGSYRGLRAFLTGLAVRGEDPAIRQGAARARDRLESGFRAWLGPPARIAVDPETGREHRWDDVVEFADEVEEGARERILGAIRATPMLREAVFLFSGGRTIRLEDILPGGIWVRLLGKDHGKAVYRVSVKTRDQEPFDVAVNLDLGRPPDEVRREVDWLIICGDDRVRAPLVERFGGYWPEANLWTEEFIAGATLDRALRKLAGGGWGGGTEERDPALWPYAAWAALSAYVDLWDRTGGADPTPANVIVPMHDYHTGARLVSIASRESFPGPLAFLRAMWERFVEPVEREYEALRGLVGWEILFSSVVEALGVERGRAVLLQAREEAPEGGAIRVALKGFLDSLGREGFLPRRLHFAVRRYRKWAEVNPGATLPARGATLRGVYDTYALRKLEREYPEIRVRFFERTVFRDADPPSSPPAALAEGLADLVRRLRAGELAPEELTGAVADLRARIDPDRDQDYFLARLTHPYLGPGDEAGFVPAPSGSGVRSEMVVTLEDADGRPYRVRHALHPREVGRLHRLFLAAKLEVRFRPEHRFLVAVNERGHLIGGLFYETEEEARAAHMDKIVVAESFQGKGIGAALLDELCNRLRTAGIRSLTTGFFRPQFFYRNGFTVERRYAGLVRPIPEE